MSAVVLYSGHVRHPDAKTVLINRETVFLIVNLVRMTQTECIELKSMLCEF